MSLVAEVMADPDKDAHVIACCLSVGLEELEKWMYRGDFTPSVRPYIDDREFNIPFADGEKDDTAYAGPPWKRTKLPRQTVFERHPTVAKLKQTGIVTKPKSSMTEESFDFHELDPWMKECFSSGDSAGFQKAAQTKFGISLREAREYLKTMRELWPKKFALGCPLTINPTV